MAGTLITITGGGKVDVMSMMHVVTNLYIFEVTEGHPYVDNCYLFMVLSFAHETVIQHKTFFPVLEQSNSLLSESTRSG